MPRPTALVAFVTAICCLVATAPASAAPLPTRVVHASGRIVPIPAAVPHEAGDMIDRRIVPDLRWIAARFPIYVTDGYSGPLPNGARVGCRGCHVRHSDHYNGLAVDIVPLRWSDRCDRNWRGITRLARWAEPRQDRPRPPFRWVGYDGDAGHGCGDHLHLSWEHAAAPQFQLAEWVEVFPVGGRIGATQPQPQPEGPRGGAQPESAPQGGARPGQAPPQGPPGGVSTVRSGGVSSVGD